MSPVTIPAHLAASVGADDNPLRAEWLADLPRLLTELAERWSLRVGAPFEPGGQTAWVAPARRASGDEVVLKVGWRHPEGEHEAEGLLAWAGDGAARLHGRHDEPQTIALLLERCLPGVELRAAEAEPRQDEVVADLLLRLWREPAPGHPFRPLQEMCDQWADAFEADPDPQDPGLARLGVALFRELPSTADRQVLLATDLHAGNILSAEREPWLVIDPKPYVGDPTYDPLQHLLNCFDRLAADPQQLIDRMAELCRVDRERLRLWLFARCVVESSSWPGAVDLARQLAPG